jgi:hypothetical protein
MTLLRKSATLLTVAACTMLAAGTAAAGPFNYSTDFTGGVGGEWTVSNYNNGDTGILGQLDGGSATLSLLSPGSGSGRLSFDLLGFRTVDGYNCCTDTFRLTVNGTEIFRGVFNMGGGGGEGIELQPAGTTVFSGAGARSISLDVALLSGPNQLSFNYGGMQGFGDEAWGLDNVNLQANVVPEPETYAMLLAGLGLLGFMARRRKEVRA